MQRLFIVENYEGHGRRAGVIVCLAAGLIGSAMSTAAFGLEPGNAARASEAYASSCVLSIVPAAATPNRSDSALPGGGLVGGFIGLLHGDRKDRFLAAIPVALSPTRQVEIISALDNSTLPLLTGPVRVNQATDRASATTGPSHCKATLVIDELGLQSTATWTALTARFSYTARDGHGRSYVYLKKTYLSGLILIKPDHPDGAEVVRSELVAALEATYQQFLRKMARNAKR